MMTTYMKAAPATQITFDLYNKLSSMSSKFKELFEKGRQEPPEGELAYAYAGALSGQMETISQPTVGKLIFCGACWAKNDEGTKFCGFCGAKLK